jgi:hypothetical protein
LRDGGLVVGEMPVGGDASAPWFVRVMLGIAGWIGALFLLGFVGAGFAFVFRNSGAAAVLGAAACAAAVAIFRVAPKNDFVAQFGLAVSLAGQALLVYAVGDWMDGSIVAIAFFVALQQALLFVLVPSFVHRLWAVWSGVVAATIALMDAGLFGFVPAVTTAAFAWVALSEFRVARHGPLVRAGVYGLALAAGQVAVLPGGLLSELFYGHSHRGLSLGMPGVWLARLALAAVLVFAAVVLLRRERVALDSGPGRIGLAVALLLGLVSIKAPGVGPAAVILIVGYANADRVLTGLGIVALLGYLSQYYYSLHATLLEKSGLLVAAGLALLLVRLAMKYVWPETCDTSEERPHA